MALGKRSGERQGEFWTATQSLPGGPGHIFYDKLNSVLAEAGFDRFAEELCEPFYKKTGRRSIPPGVYFRMIMIGYLEGIDSQRGIAWRCEDSLSLRRFLGVPLGEETPDHSSLTRIRDRLSLEVHEQVFHAILEVIHEHGLLKCKTVAVDSTLLEANAAMKSIVRKDSGEDWKAYLKQLMHEQGLITEDDEPTDEDLRKFDKERGKQGKKKVSNKEWESPVDPDARIVKMKDGRTHLGYKAEHVVDLESEVILSATIHHGTESDASTLLPNVVNAQVNVVRSGSEEGIHEVAADKGYHANETIAECERYGLRTYIPEPKRKHLRRWTDKPESQQQAIQNNRRRMSRDKGKTLQKKRSEYVERSFAHVCETGGARRTWLRGLEKINKRYLIHIAARNLGVLMRKLFGIGKPRCLQAGMAGFLAIYASLSWVMKGMRKLCNVSRSTSRKNITDSPTTRHPKFIQLFPTQQWQSMHFSTGC